MICQVSIATWKELQTEEEIERGPLAGNVAGIADGPVGGILNGAVALDVTDGLVTAVLDGPVVFDVADRPVGCILHRAVILDVANRAVGTVLDGAVALDMAHGPVAFVLDRAVTLDVADGSVGSVHDLLCMRLCPCQKEREGSHQKEGKLVLHVDKDSE